MDRARALHAVQSQQLPRADSDPPGVALRPAGTCVGAAGSVIGSQLEALAVRAIRVIVLPILGLIIGYVAGPTPAGADEGETSMTWRLSVLAVAAGWVLACASEVPPAFERAGVEIHVCEDPRPVVCPMIGEPVCGR